MGNIEHGEPIKRVTDGRERLYRTVMRRVGGAVVAADEECTDDYVPATDLRGAVSFDFLGSPEMEDAVGFRLTEREVGVLREWLTDHRSGGQS